MSSTPRKKQPYLPKGILQRLANELNLSYSGVRWRLNNGHPATIKRALDLAKEHQRLHFAKGRGNKAARVASFRESLEVIRAHRHQYTATQQRNSDEAPESYPMFPDLGYDDATA